MPYTEKAMRFFQGCKHNPRHMKGKCPSAGVLPRLISHGTKKSAKKR